LVYDRDVCWRQIYACIGIAGDPEAAKIMRTEIRERIGEEIAKSKLMGFQSPKARKGLEKIFSSKYAKNLQMLIGVRFHSGETCLFKTSGKKVVNAEIEYIGGGDSSALRYLADFLLPRHIQSISEAQMLGAYLVAVANRYVDGCSGGPDLLTIAEDGMIREWHRGVFTREEILYCEGEAGRGFRELLFSGGKKALDVIDPKPQSRAV
jgi:hypothetical protein